MIVIYCFFGLMALYGACFIFYFDIVESEEMVGLVIGAPFLASFSAVGYSGVAWLKHGAWAPLPLSDLLIWLGASAESLTRSSGWVGVDRVGEWILAQHSGWALFAVGLATFYSIASWAEAGGKARLMKAHSQSGSGED